MRWTHARAGVLPLVMVALLAAAMPLGAASIGPDAGNYVATDETTYSFVDVSGTGTRMLHGTDDAAVTVDLGFSFDLYETTYTTASLNSNGLLTFGGTPTYSYYNPDLTLYPFGPTMAFVAVLWDDWLLTGSSASAIYVQTIGSPGSRQFIAQWNLARGYNSTTGNAATFQVILSETTNRILFQYQDVQTGDFRGNGGSATVGVQDVGGYASGRTLQWSYNTPAIVDGQAILIQPACGNGLPDPGEECDDGNLVDGDGCETTCTPTGCGDGVTAGAEQCDDGNIAPGDCCTPGCQLDALDDPCDDDGNLCTVDRCDGAGTCLHTPLPTGSACPDADGNACTINPECDGGGNCVQQPAATGSPCPDLDGNACTINPECDGAGACVQEPAASGIPCAEDGNLCTIDRCDAAGTCTHPAIPQPVCRAPTESGKGRVVLRSDKLSWRWAKGAATTYESFGDPTTSTDFAVCVYDTSGAPQPLLAAVAPAGGKCVDREGCWVLFAGQRVDYVDPTGLPDGLRLMRLKSGFSGKASLVVRGDVAPASPLVPPVTVQLHNEDGECWGAVYSAPLQNDAVQFRAKPD